MSHSLVRSRSLLQEFFVLNTISNADLCREAPAGPGESCAIQLATCLVPQLLMRDGGDADCVSVMLRSFTFDSDMVTGELTIT